jgi:hypothetical protein
VEPEGVGQLATPCLGVGVGSCSLSALCWCVTSQGFELAKSIGVGKKTGNSRFFSSTGTFTQIRPGT